MKIPFSTIKDTATFNNSHFFGFGNIQDIKCENRGNCTIVDLGRPRLLSYTKGNRTFSSRKVVWLLSASNKNWSNMQDV